MNTLSPAIRAATTRPKRHQLAVRPRHGLTLPAQLGIALLNLGFLVLPGALMPAPVLGAERVYVSYGPLEFSLPISELEIYAREGKIGNELAFYTKRLDQKNLEQLRRVLLTRVDLSPVAVAQFLYSPTGEILLQRIGEVVQTKAHQPGFYALRAALIQSAASPEGLTPLNMLKKFPTYGIRINTERSFELIDQLSNLIDRTQLAIAAVEDQSLAEASTGTPVNLSQMPDLRQPGAMKWKEQTISLNDSRRSRVFPADIYLPQSSNQLPAPVIVISHGLGNDRNTFKYLAQHLASYGFVVAVPEHPGSNAQQLQALISGLARVVTPPRELIDRPLDIKYLLDELGRSFPGQVNLQNVGIIGQSFGGYTALAVAGGKLNFEQLQKDCLNFQNSLNLSLVLQCNGLFLPAADYKLQDERISAAIAINPVASSLFGEAGLNNIKVPLMVVASSADTVAPALSEQIQPFTWLTTPQKYLALFKQGTHFSTLRDSDRLVPIPAQALGPSPELAQDYMKALSVAFLKTYIANEPAYQTYLSASYAQAIGQYPIPLSLVQSLTPTQLTQERNKERPAPEPTPTPSPAP
ncbi:MAG: alpha/beta hydrolase [Aphanothece sp. CMT-3BRIN-NPC111]|jgi:predicted dienelactone hydrolase|nr:alpha/beta hydrolase [Aphanothece sp. CMT-3BRIN-NPC111]